MAREMLSPIIGFAPDHLEDWATAVAWLATTLSLFAVRFALKGLARELRVLYELWYRGKAAGGRVGPIDRDPPP